MIYKIVKMAFAGGVHLGNGMLTDGSSSLLADTCFSALCQEALQMDGGIEKLCGLVQNGKVRISDGLPYIGKTLYLPKPFLTIQGEEDGDSIKKKAFKKLTYIPMDKLNQYLAGKLDAKAENDKLASLGTYEMRNAAAINRGKDADPYHVGVFHFRSGSGLYLCVGCESDAEWKYMEELFVSLSYSGIGGRRSSGLGRFSCSIEECPKELKKRLQDGKYASYMTLSLALPEQEELDEACEKAQFSLLKRSGFVASNTYAEDFLKKRDFYGMAAGSVFVKQFKGGLYDVSFQGKHPVYRYAYPMFLGI